jgi:hypothetical protein
MTAILPVKIATFALGIWFVAYLAAKARSGPVDSDQSPALPLGSCACTGYQCFY